MDKHDAALYPGEFFIELRDKPTSSWRIWSRDNDGDVMRTRFDYQKKIAKPGQGVRFFAPDTTLIEEFLAVDKPAAVCETAP